MNRKDIEKDIKVQLEVLEKAVKNNLEGSYLKGRKSSWKLFFKFLFKINLPWIMLIISLIFGVVSVKLGVKFISYQSKFFGGDLEQKTILIGIGIMAASMVVGTCSNYIRDYTTNKISRNIRISLWNKIVRLPMTAYQSLSPREMISRITQDADLMGTAFITIIVTMFTQTYGVFEYLKQIYEVDKSLAYIQFAILPIFLILKFIAGRINYNISIRSRFKFASLTRYMVSILLNIPLIKSYNKEEYEKSRGDVAIEEYTKYQFRSEAFGIGFDLIDQVFQTLNDVVCIVYGAYLVNQGKIDIGVWITFYMFSSGIYASIQVITNLWPLAKSMQGSMQRVSDIMELEEEDVREEQEEALEIEDIHVKDVSFSYSDKKVLEQVELVFEKNKTTAVIGSSGSGKTTLLSLLSRFYQVSDGAIYNGDTNINEYSLSKWRKSIAYLQQESIVFHMSIRENLTYGLKRSVTDEELFRVLEKVGLDSFIATLPLGLDQILMENGRSISGGERQRLAIARILLRDPKIVLLDEATANLDRISERLVSQAFEVLAKDRTMIIVAHRLSTIKNADKIIVMETGKVVGVGTHQQLKETNSAYQNLIKREGGEDDEE